MILKNYLWCIWNTCKMSCSRPFWIILVNKTFWCHVTFKRMCCSVDHTTWLYASKFTSTQPDFAKLSFYDPNCLGSQELFKRPLELRNVGGEREGWWDTFRWMERGKGLGETLKCWKNLVMLWKRDHPKKYFSTVRLFRLTFGQLLF